MKRLFEQCNEINNVNSFIDYMKNPTYEISKTFDLYWNKC